MSGAPFPDDYFDYDDCDDYDPDDEDSWLEMECGLGDDGQCKQFQDRDERHENLRRLENN